MLIWVLQLISKYILLFPALDVASAFPLNAITLVRPPHVIIVDSQEDTYGRAHREDHIKDD